MSSAFFRRAPAAAVLAMLALGPAGPAAAQTDDPKPEIDVTVDFDAIGTPAAGSRWNDLPADLEDALATRLVGSPVLAEYPGTAITVDIDELSLASALEAAAGVADTTLAGQVHVSNPDQHPLSDSYDLRVSFAEVAPLYLPVGTDPLTIEIGSILHYETLVSAFADHVVTRLHGH